MKNLIVCIMLLSLFGSEVALGAEILVSSDETHIIDSIENNITNDKKSLWDFFNDNDEIKNVSDITQSINEDRILTIKKEAVEEANKSFNSDIIIGGVKEINPTKPSETVKGYINETVVLSLDDCIEKALKNSSSIRSAFSNSEIYKALNAQAWAPYFPAFNMTNGYTRNRFLSLNFEVPQTIYNYYNAVTIDTALLLFDFGKAKANADMTKKNYESTVADLYETINSTIFEVKSAYYNLIYALEAQNVYEDSVKNLELQLRQAEAFYQIGTKSKIDVSMAQYNLGNAQVGLIKAINDVDLATAKLTNSMGISKDIHYKIVEKLEINDYSYSLDELWNITKNTRPELISARKKVEAAKLLIRATKRMAYPDLNGIVMYQVGGGARFSDDYGWKLGAQFQYTNFNIYLIKKEIEEAKAVYRKALADLGVIEDDVFLELQEAYINLKNAGESIPVSALALKYSKEQFNLANGRYRAGVGNSIEVKDSENTYKNARLDYLSILLDYNVNVADLERVIGCRLKEK